MGGKGRVAGLHIEAITKQNPGADSVPCGMERDCAVQSLTLSSKVMSEI